MPSLVAVEEGLARGIREIGDLFVRMEVFLPEIVLAPKAMEASLLVPEPHLGEAGHSKKAKIVVGAVKGDVHDIGKNIVVALLESNGYEVVDLGRDVPSAVFVARAREVQLCSEAALLSQVRSPTSFSTA